MVRLFIATPCYGSQCFVEYTKSLLLTKPFLERKGIKVDIEFLVHESLITRARNTLVSKFMANKEATHLMFIDADIGWEPEDIYKMIEANKDVVGGLYPKKMLHFSNLKRPQVEDLLVRLREKDANDSSYANTLLPHLLSYVLDLDDKDQSASDNDFQELKYVGTGFMLIKRSVIEKMFEKFEDTKYIHPHLNDEESKYNYALFDCEKRGDEYLSEDFLFCQRWREMGGKIYGYFRSRLTHVGLYYYKGNVGRALGL